MAHIPEHIGYVQWSRAVALADPYDMDEMYPEFVPGPSDGDIDAGLKTWPASLFATESRFCDD